MPSEFRKGLLPRDRSVDVLYAVPFHRMCQPALLLQIIVFPLLKLGESVLCEEFRGRSAIGNFPRRRLCTIFAKFQWVRLRRLGKCATDEQITVRTPPPGPGRRNLDRDMFLNKNSRDGCRRSPAARGAAIGRDPWMCFWTAWLLFSPTAADVPVSKVLVPYRHTTAGNF